MYVCACARARTHTQHTHLYGCVPVYLRVGVGGMHVWRTCVSVLCVCVDFPFFMCVWLRATAF